MYVFLFATPFFRTLFTLSGANPENKQILRSNKLYPMKDDREASLKTLSKAKYKSQSCFKDGLLVYRLLKLQFKRGFSKS